jgi:hypothetical protein
VTVVERFIAFLETGEPGDVFAHDVFVDFTLPRWRLQAKGVADAVALRRGGHPSPGKVTRSRLDELARGFVLELEEEWLQDGDRWYCREMFRAEVRADQIVELAVYCTGDWDSARREEHARAIRLLRP